MNMPSSINTKIVTEYLMIARIMTIVLLLMMMMAIFILILLLLLLLLPLLLTLLLLIIMIMINPAANIRIVMMISFVTVVK